MSSEVHSNSARDNGHQMEHWKTQLAITKNTFTVRMVKYWNRLPREVMESSSLERFRTQQTAEQTGIIGPDFEMD